MNAIEIDHITKTYRNTAALSEVSLCFESGKIYGLLGRNGAGKSTLLHLIGNRIFPDSGHITIDGESAFENSAVHEKVFCMCEKELYPPTKKVKALFTLTASFYGCFDQEKALRYAQLFGLKLNSRLNALSTGYRSIFKLIVALCLDLPYLFLDEPVLGLDANHRELFYKLLLQEYEEKPRTIVIATHLIEEVANLIEDVVIIDKGKLILQTSVEELRKTGYSVSGPAGDVDAYCMGRNVIGADHLGGLKIAYLLGQTDPASLTAQMAVSPINLQKLFVKLTESGEQI